MVEGGESIGEGSHIALDDTGSAGLAGQVGVCVVVGGALRDAVVVVEVRAHTLGAVGSDNAASGTDRRASSTGDFI